MRHLNSIVGFESVKPVFEKTRESVAWIGQEFFRIRDCVEQSCGMWEGTLMKYVNGPDGFIIQKERVSFIPPKLDPHNLIQSNNWGHDDLNAYNTAVDDHVSQCSDCEKKMRRSSGAVLLPKLRAKITVHFPKPQNYEEYMAQLEQLKPGQCLSCGCIVLDIKWTREQARDAFYEALGLIMELSQEEVIKIGEQVKMLDLPVATEPLRRLRDKFWLPDGSLGTEEGRDREEGDEVRQLPETVGEFIDQILRMHYAMSYVECGYHWIP